MEGWQETWRSLEEKGRYGDLVATTTLRDLFVLYDEGMISYTSHSTNGYLILVLHFMLHLRKSSVVPTLLVMLEYWEWTMMVCPQLLI